MTQTKILQELLQKGYPKDILLSSLYAGEATLAATAMQKIFFLEKACQESTDNIPALLKLSNLYLSQNDRINGLRILKKIQEKVDNLDSVANNFCPNGDASNVHSGQE